jgi:hypothetical protein
MMTEKFFACASVAKMTKFNAIARTNWDHRETGGASVCRVFSLLFSDRGWGMDWILRLAAAGGEGPSLDIMEINKPDDLGDIAYLGLTLAEAKQLLARVQCEISSAQASKHAARRHRAIGSLKTVGEGVTCNA